MKTASLRHKLMKKGLQRSELDENPFTQFDRWFTDAIEADIPEPGAMSIATVDKDGQPWQRIVLLKFFDQHGFVFFTNYSSRKAMHITTNHRVSLLFPWHALGRQINITGLAEKVSRAESLSYFMSRSRGSQIGAWASPQSQVITSRALLDTMFDNLKKKFFSGEVPLPSFWGGYRVVPKNIEFWQARDDRLHDRFMYKKNENNDWIYERLAP